MTEPIHSLENHASAKSGDESAFKQIICDISASMKEWLSNRESADREQIVDFLIRKVQEDDYAVRRWLYRSGLRLTAGPSEKRVMKDIEEWARERSSNDSPFAAKTITNWLRHRLEGNDDQTIEMVLNFLSFGLLRLSESYNGLYYDVLQSNVVPEATLRRIRESMLVPYGMGTAGYFARGGRPVCIGNTFVDLLGKVAMEDFILGNVSFMASPVFDDSNRLMCIVTCFFPARGAFEPYNRLALKIYEQFLKIVERNTTAIRLAWKLEQQKATARKVKQLTSMEEDITRGYTGLLDTLIPETDAISDPLGASVCTAWTVDEGIKQLRFREGILNEQVYLTRFISLVEKSTMFPSWYLKAHRIWEWYLKGFDYDTEQKRWMFKYKSIVFDGIDTPVAWEVGDKEEEEKRELKIRPSLPIKRQAGESGEEVIAKLYDEYEREGWLFCTRLEFQSDLDESNISDDFRREFKEKGGIILSRNVTVSRCPEVTKWLITDEGNKQTYSVLKKKDKLDVYKGDYKDGLNQVKNVVDAYARTFKQVEDLLVPLFYIAENHQIHELGLLKFNSFVENREILKDFKDKIVAEYAAFKPLAKMFWLIREVQKPQQGKRIRDADQDVLDKICRELETTFAKMAARYLVGRDEPTEFCDNLNYFQDIFIQVLYTHIHWQNESEIDDLKNKQIPQTLADLKKGLDTIREIFTPGQTFNPILFAISVWLKRENELVMEEDPIFFRVKKGKYETYDWNDQKLIEEHPALREEFGQISTFDVQKKLTRLAINKLEKTGHCSTILLKDEKHLDYEEFKYATRLAKPEIGFNWLHVCQCPKDNQKFVSLYSRKKVQMGEQIQNIIRKRPVDNQFDGIYVQCVWKRRPQLEFAAFECPRGVIRHLFFNRDSKRHASLNMNEMNPNPLHRPEAPMGFFIFNISGDRRVHHDERTRYFIYGSRQPDGINKEWLYTLGDVWQFPNLDDNNWEAFLNKVSQENPWLKLFYKVNWIHNSHGENNRSFFVPVMSLIETMGLQSALCQPIFVNGQLKSILFIYSIYNIIDDSVVQNMVQIVRNFCEGQLSLEQMTREAEGMKLQIGISHSLNNLIWSQSNLIPFLDKTVSRFFRENLDDPSLNPIRDIRDFLNVVSSPLQSLNREFHGRFGFLFDVQRGMIGSEEIEPSFYDNPDIDRSENFKAVLLTSFLIALNKIAFSTQHRDQVAGNALGLSEYKDEIAVTFRNKTTTELEKEFQTENIGELVVEFRLNGLTIGWENVNFSHALRTYLEESFVNALRAIAESKKRPGKLQVKFDPAKNEISIINSGDLKSNPKGDGLNVMKKMKALLQSYLTIQGPDPLESNYVKILIQIRR